MRDADGTIIVYDVTNRDSFDNVRVWLKAELDHNMGGNHKETTKILVGSKCDQDSKREVSWHEGNEYATQ